MCERAGIIMLAIFASMLSLNHSTARASSTSAAGAEIKSRFDLPAEPLDKALRDFAIQANCNISYEPSIVAGLQAPAIKGEFTVGSVLSFILTGTNLRAVNVNEDTIQIVAKPQYKSHESTSNAGDQYLYGVADLRVAQAGPSPVPNTSSDPTPADPASEDAKARSHNDLDEITVTGTHIRGTKDSPSPVQIYTRDDIDATGTITIQQFLQTLPQNFGGASENTIGQIAANSQTNNTVNGSAPNLRGLGADATLVLLNGHRVAPGNSDGSFVDISMIPLAAVDRIEIVTDGASAIYGSDAVGGVVNIILRSKFDGAESRAAFGSVGTGSLHNTQAAQTVGDDWANGSAVLSYQYSDQTPLSAGSRDYLHSVLLPFNLLPEQVQHAAFLDVNQEMAPGFTLRGDAMYSHRSTDTVSSFDDGSFGNFLTINPSKIDSYSTSLGSTVELPRHSELGIVSTYSENDTWQELFQTPSVPALQNAVKTKSSVISVDANLDGLLASIPAGPVQYAIGGQFREESFGNTFVFPPTNNTFYPKRNVRAGYLELHVPIVGEQGASHDGPVLELTAADRAEHYSDFGSTNNPQVGAIWKPVTSLAIRGTYGTSFKAPLLSQLNPIPSQVVAFPGALFNPGQGANPNVLIVDGGNPGLKPEKATVWTAGLDFKPEEIPGLTTKLTYYDITFKDQIVVASASVNTANVFVDETILGPEVVQRNPPSSLIQQLVGYPTYVNPLNVDPASIGAVFDDRSLNLSTVKTTGLDFRVGYKTIVGGSQIDTGVDGTYIFKFDNQFSVAAPVTSILNTSYNPVDLRLRGRAIVTQGPLSAGIYLNFTNSYTDNNVVPNVHVASWTTADANISYVFASKSAPSKGISLALSVTNLTDRPPPYVSNPFGYPITYDGVNANPLGRYFSLLLQKRW
jgi:iron complex outermembrane receptor protein